MLVLGILPAGSVSNMIALGVFVVLVFAVVAGMGELRSIPLSLRSWDSPDTQPRAKRRVVLTAIVISGGVPALAMQSWFSAGTALAGGDSSPPNGTTWIAHLFAPWVWSGSNFGGPGGLETLLPWAVVLKVVRDIGGSAALAQRLWLTGLLAGVGLLALAALTALGLRTLPAAIGALFYVFNPFLVNIGFASNYIAALLLLPGVIALVLWVSRGRLRITWGIALLVFSTPLIGYVYTNPPLAGMVLVGLVASAMLAAYLGGSVAARRAAKLVLIGLPVLVLASAYWVVPSYFQLSVVATAHLSSLSNWAWSQGRASIRNGFWLNDNWAWKYPAYFPFAPGYGRFPLNILRFALPAVAFSALILPSADSMGKDLSRWLFTMRVSIVAATTSLIFIFLSTGTNSPGTVIFGLLYSLPFGWLLQNPGRFLYVVGLSYAVLITVVVEWCWYRIVGGSVLRRLALNNRFLHIVLVSVSAVLAVTVVAAPSYPIVTGAVVPNHRPQGYPGSHVRVPSYWSSMARFLNSKDKPGNLLLLPPDDFYQMPYRWGYYGADDFIIDMVGRHVIDPAPTTYYTVSGQLSGADALLAESLLKHKWILATRLMQALETSQLLVRGDILNSFPGRSIISPAALIKALKEDPFVKLIQSDGPLSLFGFSSGVGRKEPSRAVTVASSHPMIQVLVLLPTGSALVTGPPISGVPAVVQAPPLSLWPRIGDTLRTSFPVLNSRIAEASTINGAEVSQVQTINKGTTLVGSYQLTAIQRGSTRVINARVLLGPDVSPDGMLNNGLWEPVATDCNNSHTAHAQTLLNASLLPRQGPAGTPALRLTAGIDSACESNVFTWHSGPILLRFWVRHLVGAQPRVCLWETGPNHCLNNLPALPTGSGWQRYSTIVQPDPGTTALSLTLYADSTVKGQVTTNEYAHVVAFSLPTSARLVVLSKVPRGSSVPPVHLIASDTTWSPAWKGTPGSRHVLIDGMRNGWLLPVNEPLRDFAIHYVPSTELLISRWISAVVAGLMLLLVAPRKSLLKLLMRLFARHRQPAGSSEVDPQRV